jgi:hypothetical protein
MLFSRSAKSRTNAHEATPSNLRFLYPTTDKAMHAQGVAARCHPRLAARCHRRGTARAAAPLRLPPNCVDVTAERVALSWCSSVRRLRARQRSQDDRRRIDRPRIAPGRGWARRPAGHAVTAIAPLSVKMIDQSYAMRSRRGAARCKHGDNPNGPACHPEGERSTFEAHHFRYNRMARTIGTAGRNAAASAYLSCQESRR